MELERFISKKYFQGFFEAPDGDMPVAVKTHSKVQEVYAHVMKTVPTVQEWTKAEVKQLGDLLKKQQIPNWDLVSNSFPRHSAESCSTNAKQIFAKNYNNSKLTEEEMVVLRMVVNAHRSRKDYSWSEIETSFNEAMKSKLRSDIKIKYLKRSALTLLRAIARERILEKRASVGPKWTDDEQKQLRKGVEIYGNNFKEISILVETRSNDACYSRWERNDCPAVQESKGRKWTEDEKATLARVMECYQGETPTPWTLISRHVPGRTPHQCRERNYQNSHPSGRHKRKNVEIQEKPFTDTESTSQKDYANLRTL